MLWLPDDGYKWWPKHAGDQTPLSFVQ